MADSNETLGELYTRIGLNFDDLDRGFLDVETSLKENMARLNQQTTLIDLNASVKIQGLDKINDEVKIFEIRQKELQEKIDVAKQKLNLLSADLASTAAKFGANSKEAKKASIAYQRQVLAVGKLNSKLKQLETTHKNTAEQAKKFVNWGKLFDSIGIGTRFDNGATLLSSFEKIKESVPGLTKAIDSVATSFGKLPTPAKIAATSILAIPAAVKTAESGILKLAEPAVTAGDTFYVASRGAQMTKKEFAKLSDVCKVTGIDLNEVLNVMKRLNMQLTRSEDKGITAKMLKKFGVEVRYTNGELKNAYDLSIALAEGLKRAKAAGKGKEFISGVFARQASGDIVTYLEDLEGNIDLAGKLVGNGLFDPARAHNVQGEINALNAQAGKLQSTFSNIFVPAAEVLVPKLRDRLKDLTQVINDNSAGIQKFGEALANIIDVGSAAVNTVAKLGTSAVGTVGNVFFGDRFIKNYGNMAQEIKSVDDLIKFELQKMLPTQKFALQGNAAEYKRFLDNMKYEWRKIQKFRKEQAENQKKNHEQDEEELSNLKDLNEEELNLLHSYKGELKKLEFENKFGESDSYKKSLAELEKWKSEELAKVKDNEILKTKIKEIETEKRLKIENDYNQKIKAIEQDTANISFGLTHSAFEKELRDIRQLKEEQLKKAETAKETAAIVANSAAKEAKAVEDEIDRIKGKQLTLAEKFFKKTHSQADWDIYQAEKEAQQMLDEGIYHPADILEMLGMEVGDIEKRARKDKAYRAEPEINFALPEIDYYGQITDLVDEVMEGYTALSRAQKDALGLFNIPDKVDYKNPFGEAQESLKLADLLADDFSRADKAVNDFVDTVNDARIEIDYANDIHTDTADLPKPTVKSFLPKPTVKSFQSARADETSSIDEKIKLAAQKLKAADNPNLPASKIELPRLDNIAAEIAELTRTAGTIANTVTQRQAAKQQQQIILNLSPNIDLGGAYVFDNALKLALVNDVTTEVANAVKDAVQRATVNLIPN